MLQKLSLIHISEPTRLLSISYAVFCLKKTKTALGQVTGIQTLGNIDQPLNPIMLALASGATFVARGFTGRQDHLVKLMKEAINHPGYALVDIPVSYTHLTLPTILRV